MADTSEYSSDKNYKDPFWKNVGFWRFAFCLLILSGFLFRYIRNPEKLPDMKSIKWNFFVWIILLSAVANLISGWSYSMVILRSQPSIKIWQIIRAFIISRGLNLITPQSGTVFFAMTLKKRSGLAYTEYAASMAAFVWLDLTLACLAAACALRFSPSTDENLVLTALFLVCFAISITGIRILRRLVTKDFLKSLPFMPESASIRLGNMFGTLSRLVNNRSLCLKLAGMGLISTMIHGVRLLLCFAMVEAWIPWPEAFATTILVKATNTLAITPGNLGILEGLIGYMGTVSGLSLGAAIIAGVAYRFASYIALMSMSLFFTLIKPDSHL